MTKKVLAALSGGVDSAVTALLLQKYGYEVSGATLFLCDGAEEEAASAARLCEKLGISHTVLDKRELFRDTVIRSFCESYACGETPNPCTVCNPLIKFGLLCDMAQKEGFDFVATGHYAICEYSEKYGRYVIKKAKDPKKDQSYMLWGLEKSLLPHILFPLGSFDKSDTRAVAEEHGFESAAKKDSQDICFIKNTDYADFVSGFLKKNFPDGNFVTEDGRILGRHKGLIRYTHGQRKGLGLSLPAPLYVKEKRPQTNEVVLSPEDRIFSASLVARDINLLAVEKDAFPMRAFAKTRYSQKETACYAELCEDKLKITFDSPVRAVTPGQSAVLYDGDGVLLGGAVIENADAQL